MLINQGVRDYLFLSLHQSQFAQEPDRFLIIFGISSEPLTLLLPSFT